VGSGPAGSTAAAILARRGWKVLLVDRAAFPRDKTCGNGLSPRAIPGINLGTALPYMAFTPRARWDILT
jgi:menaquinone-9 beta-reductase